jgi:hypothetical protein
MRIQPLVSVAKAVHRRRFGDPDRPTAAHRIRDVLEELARAA